MKKINRWVYAVIGIVVLLLDGLVYAWSVMSKTIGAARPGWTAAQLSLTFTLVMAFFCIGCLVAGILSKRVRPNVYVILSGCLFLVGFLTASLTGASPAMLYLGFGILCGLGAGFAYNAVMSTMSAWFPDRQGLISGLLMMGFGLSAFLVGKVFVAVNPPTGDDSWKLTFRVLGMVIAVVFVAASFFFVRPGRDFVPPAAAKKKAVRQPALDLPLGAAVRRPAFWLYYVWAILISAAGLVVVSQASGIAAQAGVGVDASAIATAVGLISIMNGLGRVTFGALFDRKGYRLTMLLDMAIFAVAGLVLLGALKGGSFPLVVVGFLLGGFAYGGVPPTNSAIVSDFFGRTHYAINFSLVNTNLLIASFASTIAGRLYDRSQSYLSTILMLLAVVILGAVVFIPLRRPAGEKGE